MINPRPAAFPGARFRVNCPEAPVLIRPFVKADIPEAAALYRDIQIKKSDYLKRLDPESDMSFSRRGGMFLVHNEQSLLSLLNSPEEVFWVARNDAGALCGIFWCGLDDSKYHAPENILMDDPGSLEDVKEAMNRGVAYFSKEIIIRNTRRLAESFFLITMRMFLDAGFESTWGEVYRTNWYDDGGGRREADMLNEASLRMLLRTGCRRVGQFKPTLLNAEGYDVSISAQILTWDLAHSVNKLSMYLDEKGVIITQEEA